MPIDVTPRPEADRQKAFELWMSASQSGKQRSFRAIASDIGVSAMTVGRWAEVDDWQGKLNKILSQTAQTTESTSQAIKRRVRRGLLDGLDELNSIVQDPKVPARDRIAAVKALADIAKTVDAVMAAAGGTKEHQQVPEFRDDLPEVTNPWQTTEKPSKPDETADGEALALKLPESLPETLLPSPEEALASLLVDESRVETTEGSVSSPPSSDPS